MHRQALAQIVELIGLPARPTAQIETRGLQDIAGKGVLFEGDDLHDALIALTETQHANQNPLRSTVPMESPPIAFASLLAVICYSIVQRQLRRAI